MDRILPGARPGRVDCATWAARFVRRRTGEKPAPPRGTLCLAFTRLGLMASAQRLFELKIRYGVAAFDPAGVDPVRLRRLVETWLTIESCAHHRLLPVREEEGALAVAMVDPERLEALDELQRRGRLRGLALRRLAIDAQDFALLLEACQAAPMEPEAAAGELEAPVVRLSSQILDRAVAEGASDIHIEPQPAGVRVRLRRDGVLHEAGEPLSAELGLALVSRFKILSELDIAERRLPQDGRLYRRVGERAVDFRVSTLPGRFGEKVVLRLLDNAATRLGLDQLIGEAGTLTAVRALIRRPHGLFLVTGPTGSGKTTTLYAALAERNEPGVNIATAEDPVEYTLAGITQVQVIREKGLDFARILRALLRQDPDIVLVGETRDRETAQTAIEAALTGHLVLTSLHTNDAAGAVARLRELGVAPYLIASALVGVLAQRLLRRLCSECKEAYVPPPERLARFGLTGGTYFQVRGQRGAACPGCGGVGYKGRVGVYEIMSLGEHLRQLIGREATTQTLREAAAAGGMRSLLAGSLDLARAGVTSLEEVERVTLCDTDNAASPSAASHPICRGCGGELHSEWLACPYCTLPRID
nr:GspE/PulE family protein [Gloeobacter morelensis]